MEKIKEARVAANVPVTVVFYDPPDDDFYEIGRQAADPIVQILSGVNVRTIPSQKPIIKKLSLNLKKAQNLNIKIKRQVILKTDNIVD